MSSTQLTLGTLERYRSTAPPSMRVEDLYVHLRDTGAPAVLIEDEERIYGVIVARRLDSFLSRPFGRELAGRKPVTSLNTFVALLDQNPLIMEADQPLAPALEAALKRGELAYDPILVRDPSGALMLVQIDTLLRAQANTLELANREKDALIEEIRRSENELRLALYRLRETQDRLVKSEKMASLGQLVAGIAHEINTPIGVALTAASYFGERTTALAQAFDANTLSRNVLQRYIGLGRETAEMIAFNIGRAAQLIRDFKQVAVDQTSELQRSFDLAEFLQQLIRSLEPDIRKSGHSVELDCPQGITIDSFPGALGQVITNLVSNAVIHAYERGDGGVVTVRGESLTDGHIGLVISDSGRGMPPDVQAKIYDPFFTTRRGSGGSGLGMHIVFNLVTERLKGEILCDSAVGKGTRFTLSMPRVAPKELKADVDADQR